MKTTAHQIEEAKLEIQNAHVIMRTAGDGSVRALHASRVAQEQRRILEKLGACGCAVCVYRAGNEPCPIVDRSVAEILAAWDACKSKRDFDDLTEAEYTSVVERARELCAAQNIAPADIEFVNGPDEWGVVNEGTWSFDYTPIDNAELCKLLDIITLEASDLSSL